MNESEVAETIERYSRRLREYGATEKALGWGEKNRSRLRFEILLSHWKLEEKSVLDLGCGFGDLFKVIEDKIGSGFEYTGVDINAELITIATNRYPKAIFKVANVLTDKFDFSFDYAFASGIFNHRLKDNFDFVQRIFEKLAEKTRIGFAVNFLSNRVDFELENTYHADPCKILELAYTYSNNIVLRNDYMPFEFSVFVNTGEKIDSKMTVYENFLQSTGN